MEEKDNKKHTGSLTNPTSISTQNPATIWAKKTIFMHIQQETMHTVLFVYTLHQFPLFKKKQSEKKKKKRAPRNLFGPHSEGIPRYALLPALNIQVI